jgi:hypothetical protein
MAFNVKGKRRFFAPDKRKRGAFFRAQKNVAEKNGTKGVPAPSAHPTAVLRSPSRPNGRRSVYRLLSDGLVFNHFILPLQ